MGNKHQDNTLVVHTYLSTPVYTPFSCVILYDNNFSDTTAHEYRRE